MSHGDEPAGIRRGNADDAAREVRGVMQTGYYNSGRNQQQCVGHDVHLYVVVEKGNFVFQTQDEGIKVGRNRRFGVAVELTGKIGDSVQNGQIAIVVERKLLNFGVL